MSYPIIKDDRLPLSAYLLIVSATTVIGALGSSLGGQIAAIIGAVCGLGWGLLLGVMSNQLTRRGPTWSRCWLFFGSLVAATLLMRTSLLRAYFVFGSMQPAKN